MSEAKPNRILMLIDRIEHSSYPVTETGYALTYRAFLRAAAQGGEVFVAYPDSTWMQATNGNVRIQAHRVLSFAGAPYNLYQSQRDTYRPGAHVGSLACHEQAAAATLRLEELDAVVW